MIWSLIGSIGGKVLDIVDDVVEDKDEANRLKFLLQMEPADEPKRVHYKDLLHQFLLKNEGLSKDEQYNIDWIVPNPTSAEENSLKAVCDHVK